MEPEMELTEVGGDVFTAGISQESHGSKAQTDQFVVEWVELAQSRNVKEQASKQSDISFKRTAGRNQFTNEAGKANAMKINMIQPTAKRGQTIDFGMSSRRRGVAEIATGGNVCHKA